LHSLLSFQQFFENTISKAKTKDISYFRNGRAELVKM
jgi:hypothetical protein